MIHAAVQGETENSGQLASSRVSLRTCVGCRRAVPIADVIRVTLSQGRLHWGPRQTRSGRGASIHPTTACIASAVNKNGFSRAFRTSVVAVNSDGVAPLVEEIQIAFRSQQRRNG